MVSALQSRGLMQYGSTLLAVFAAWSLRLLLDKELGDHVPYVTFYLPILLAARWGGLGPSLMALALGAIASAYSFIPPYAGTTVYGIKYQIGMVLYLAVGLAIALLGQARQVLRTRADFFATEASQQRTKTLHESEKRRQAHKAMEAAEERLQCILDSIPALISYVDARGCYQLNNRAYERWFGHDRLQIAGKHLSEVLGSQAWDRLRPFVESALSGQPVSFESVVPYHGAGLRYVHADYIPQTSKEGESLGFVALVQDITERKQAEVELAEGATRFRQVMEMANEGIWILDSAGLITGVNTRMAAMLGHPQEDMCGRHKWDFFLDDDKALAVALFERRRLGLVEQVSVRLRHKDGKVVWAILAARPLLDETGAFLGSLDMFTDVSEQRKAEQALRESEERLSLVMQATEDALWDLDLRTGTVWRNQAYEDHFGRIPPECRSRQEWWKDNIHPEDRARVLSSFQDSLAKGESRWNGEYRLMRTDGTYAEVLDRGYIARDEQGNGIRALGAILDITERKRMEAALRESEMRLRLAAEGAHVGFWFWDIHTDRLEWTPMCKRLLGVPQEQEVTYPMFLDLLLPEDSLRMGALVDRLLKRGEDFASEYRVRWPDGSIRWISSLGHLQCKPDGSPQDMSGVAIDITDRKRAEESLREADRRKDEFLATLAHELRNPLAPIRNAVHILHALGPQEQRLLWARDVIDRQVQQMSRLVDDLLDVSRITQGKIQLRKEHIALSEVVKIATEISRPLIENGKHTLTVTVSPEPVLVEADATRLVQVLANLLNNAAKYTEEKGHIWLTAACEAEQAVIRVRDDGMGIPQDMLPRIFDMFTQVKSSLQRSQGGLGIGLTLVKKLVEMHGGTVSAYSDGLGQGSEFVVRLPLAAVRAPQAPSHRGAQAQDTRALQQARLRILVVDDNKDSAETLTLALGVRGHEVRTAYDGYQAVEMAKDFIPDVVLLDIGLPGISGYEVARRIRKQPMLKGVVLIAQTGWGQEEDCRQSQAAGFDYHFVKPIDLPELYALLAELGSFAVRTPAS